MKNPSSSWIILGSAWFISLAVYSSMLSLPPMEHIIREELLVSPAQIGLLLSIPVAALATISLLGGFLADRIGIQKAAGIGAIIMASGSVLRGTANDFATLVVFTSVFAIGWALIFPNLPKLVSAYFPEEKVGLATGIYSTGMAVGGALGLAATLPIIFPITNTFQGTFYTWGILAIASAVLWWVTVKEPSRGSIIQSQPASGVGRSSGAVWKNKSLWLVALLLFFCNLHFYTWVGWTPALMRMKGASPELAALITSVIEWVIIPAGFLIPWASYKLGLRKPFIWSLTALLAMASLGAIYVSLPWSWPLMAVVGITTGGTFAMILALPAEMLPRESVGTASGLVLSFGYLGGLVGSLMGGYVLNITGNLDLALIILSGTAVIWTGIAFLIPETGPRARLPK